MDVVIIGAGSIGYTIARTLSHRHSVTVVEQDEERFEYIVENLNVGAINANGASPRVLKGVIAPKTDILLAVTESDEVNIFACMVAKQIKPDIVTMARVRNTDYDVSELPPGFMPVDHVFSPEYLTAVKMKRIALMENAIDFETIAPLGIEVAKFRLSKKHGGVTSLPIKHLPIPDDSKVIVIHRNGAVVMPKGDEFLRPDDEITVVGKGDGLDLFDQMLGVTREPKDFIIVGGGIVGEHLATMLEAEKVNVKLIESSRGRCTDLSKKLNHTVIVCDNGSDPAVLRNENVNMADVLLAVDANEEDNLLACLIGKHLGVGKVVALYSKRDYEQVFDMSGIDAAIGYYHVVANEIVKWTSPEVETLLLMESFSEEFFMIEVSEWSRVRGLRIGEIELPEMSMIALMIKDGNVEIPRPDRMLLAGDKVLIYTVLSDIPRLERMFNARIPVSP